jgi:hypothetical protein
LIIGHTRITILLEVHRADLDEDLELDPNEDIAGDGNIAITNGIYRFIAVGQATTMPDKPYRLVWLWGKRNEHQTSQRGLSECVER